MELQIIQGLPSLDSEGSILKALELRGVIKLPLSVYQMMADSINANDILEENQRRIRKLLQSYLIDEYPDMVLESFAEVLKEDAKKVSLYLPWGFYVKLQPRFGEKFPQGMIADTLKQLTFGE